MPRISPLENPTGKSKELVEGIKSAMGSVPNIFATMAHAPAALEAYLRMNGALSGGQIGDQLKERIALAVAGYNGCDYCASAHSYLGDKAGISEEEIKQALKGEASDEKTQAALSFVRALLENRGRVSDADVSTVKDAGYSEEEIIEMVAHVALNTFTNYFNETTLTEIDFPTKVSTKDVRKVA